MSIKAALHRHLTSDTAVAGLVGTRVYPHTAPQHTPLPYLTLQRIGDIGDQHMRGAGELTRLNEQVDCWAGDSPTLERVHRAVRVALDRFRGTMHGVDVRNVIVQNELDTYEPPDDGSERGTYRTIMDLEIWHRR